MFTSSFAQAIGLLHVARGLGRAVPADLSVIAYDELPVAEYLSPPVTTVAMPLSELGAAAVEILVELLDGRDAALAGPGLGARARRARLHGAAAVTIPGRPRGRLRDTLRPTHPSEENRV